MYTCWCGNKDFFSFNADYGECGVCGTLVSLNALLPEQLQVNDDETDFYGKKYWLNHQIEDFGYPGIENRARADLPERNLHWLKTLLKFSLPPATVLELGCSHGSFVALLKQSGYNASGVEMSPWVVGYGQKTFDVPIFIGPVETLKIPLGSLDVIALMDVLEHLPDPVATMSHCLQLLKPDGLLLIQTPQFKEGMHYPTLVETRGAFLEQLKPDEHLFLFSDRSVRELFRRLGAEYIQFEPAIFGHYDMFFAVSRVPFKIHDTGKIESVLLETAAGRMTLAFLDLQKRELEVVQKLKESETDRAARLNNINALNGMLKDLEYDHLARGEQIDTLTVMLREVEADRAARGDQIDTLTVMVREVEVDRAARGEQIDKLTAMLIEVEADRAARGEQIDTLTAMLQKSEADRLAKGALIDVLKENLHILFLRKSFHWLNKLTNWPEVNKITEIINKLYE